MERNDILRHFKGVIDSTLREGFQFSRANFSPAASGEIFRFLARIGVDFVEVGNPAQPEVTGLIAALAPPPRAGARPGSSATSGTSAEDVGRGRRLRRRRGQHPLHRRRRAAGGHGADAGDLPPTGSAGNIRERQGGRARRSGSASRTSSASPQDPARTSTAGAEAAASTGSPPADTLGRAMGWEVGAGRSGPCAGAPADDIEVHFHNDLGHAVSNALAAAPGRGQLGQRLAPGDRRADRDHPAQLPPGQPLPHPTPGSARYDLGG